MQIGRRAFLKYCIGSAATLGLPLSVLTRLEKAHAAGGAGLPKVVWLNGANCTGCTISLANHISSQKPVDIADLLVNTIDLDFHPNLMGGSGDLAVQCLADATKGEFVLIVDGGIPTAFDGHTCVMWSEQGREVTAKEAVLTLAPKAAAVVCVGTCASFGGIPAGQPNPTQIVSVGQLTGGKTINIPGCPPHPEWIIWSVANLLAGVTPTLDQQNRPVPLYGKNVHQSCPRRGMPEAKTLGQDQNCLKELGCKGPRTNADCPQRQWNNATNWCIGANAVCLGCTEGGFPDKFSPFYKVEYQYQDYTKPDPDTPPQATDLRVTKAVYDSEKRELRVEGQGIAGAIVKIFNDTSGRLMGAVSVEKGGVWRFRARRPRPIPSHVRAESKGETVTANVTAKA